jgi:hypothetical protein
VDTQRAETNTAEIVVTTDGFLKRLNGRELFRVCWSDVREIRAYKRDLLATDRICLGFRDTQADEYFEVHEEMIGFDLLRTRLAEVFPTIPSGWFEDVMHPAFATNLVVLFQRPS